MIQSLIPKIQIVVLSNPVSTWDDPTTRDLFFQLISLKLKGYGRAYPDGVIAVDSIDFIADHLLLCEQRRDGGLRVLMGYKSVLHSRCEHYHLPFPALPLLKSSKADQYIPKIEKILEDAKNRKEELAYSSSWTIDEHAQKNRELNRYLRKLFTTMIIGYHRDYNIPQWMTCGVVRFKTDEYFDFLGGKALTDAFPQYSLEGEPVRMFHIVKHSEQALASAAENEQVWKDRLYISPKTETPHPEEQLAVIAAFKKAA
jgi:hypothetical protein